MTKRGSKISLDCSFKWPFHESVSTILQCCRKVPINTILQCGWKVPISTLWPVWFKGRVGTSLIGFLSNLLIFCERKSDSLRLLFKKEQMSKGAKSDRSDSLLGIIRGRKSEKLSKTYKNTKFLANHSFFASNLLESRAYHSHRYFLRSDKSESLCCKERHERIAHGANLKWAILSEWSKDRIPNPVERCLFLQYYQCGWKVPINTILPVWLKGAYFYNITSVVERCLFLGWCDNLHTCV